MQWEKKKKERNLGILGQVSESPASSSMWKLCRGIRTWGFPDGPHSTPTCAISPQGVVLTLVKNQPVLSLIESGMNSKHWTWRTVFFPPPPTCPELRKHNPSSIMLGQGYDPSYLSELRLNWGVQLGEKTKHKQPSSKDSCVRTGNTSHSGYSVSSQTCWSSRFYRKVSTYHLLVGCLTVAPVGWGSPALVKLDISGYRPGKLIFSCYDRARMSSYFLPFWPVAPVRCTGQSTCLHKSQMQSKKNITVKRTIKMSSLKTQDWCFETLLTIVTCLVPFEPFHQSFILVDLKVTIPIPT